MSSPTPSAANSEEEGERMHQPAVEDLAASASAARAAKKISGQVLQQEREALSVNAIAQLEAQAKEADSADLYTNDGKKKNCSKCSKGI